ncbi:MAG: hypothetical protein ACRCZO_20275 [Cetobacterium sp.]
MNIYDVLVLALLKFTFYEILILIIVIIVALIILTTCFILIKQL